VDDSFVIAQEIDDDTLNFVISPSDLDIAEGGTASFDVRLNFDPGATITATITRSSGDTDITVQSGINLTFSSANWNLPHTVTLAAAEDDDAENGVANILVHDDASSIADRNVTANEVDNDTLSIETSTNSLAVDEGGVNTFDVRLTADPLAPVNVSADNVLGDTDIQPTPDPTTLIFNSSNWGDWRTVTISAAEDADSTGGTATIRVSAAGFTNVDVLATEIDDDSMNFQTRYTPLSIPEGATATFGVRLSAQPSGAVNATVFRAWGDSDITIQSSTSLSFNPVNWNVYQDITLEAAEDPDVTDGTAGIRITDDAAIIADRTVRVTEQDNDTSNGAISLILNPSEAASGQEFNVSVQIANNNQVVSNFEFDFIFDYNIFSFEGIQVGSLTSDWSLITQNVSQSRITIQGTGGTSIPLSSNGTLATLILKVQCLSFTSAIQRPLRIENYTGDMQDAFTPEPCTSDFTYLPCSVLGDVNGDAGVTPGDAQDAFEIFLGVQTPDMCQQMTADANCSGSITPGDAQDIFEHFLGINTLPVCCADALQPQQVSLTVQPSRIFPIDDGNRPGFRRLIPYNTTGRAGEIVPIPVLITNPQGISRFALDMNYPHEMLEYLGVKKSPMTEEFDYVTGSEEIQGLIHIMGESTIPIDSTQMGSLAVVVFRVKQGMPDRLPVFLFNPEQDILNAEIRQGSFARVDPEFQDPGWIILGKASRELDGTVRIPVRVSRVFDMRSFGMELRYSERNLYFVGIEQSDISQNFMAIEGNEVEQGFVRIGGYGMNMVQKRSPGILFNLIFINTGGDGDVELTYLYDDLKNFEKRKTNTRIE
jgi:hypothetical protein